MHIFDSVFIIMNPLSNGNDDFMYYSFSNFLDKHFPMNLYQHSSQYNAFLQS